MTLVINTNDFGHVSRRERMIHSPFLSTFWVILFGKKFTNMKNLILEVSAMMKVRDGKLNGFKEQAAEIIRLAKEKDTKTLRYDWFLSKDGTECEVREVYESSEGLIEHRMHIVEALKKLFSEFAEGHAVKIYGDLSPQLTEMLNGLKNVNIKRYSFLQGFESHATPELESSESINQ